MIKKVDAFLPNSGDVYENPLWAALRPQSSMDSGLFELSGEIIGSMKKMPSWLRASFEPPEAWSPEYAARVVANSLAPVGDDRLAVVLQLLDPLRALGYSLCVFRIAAMERGDRARAAAAVLRSIFALNSVRHVKPLLVRILDYFWWVLAADEILRGTDIESEYPLLRVELIRRSTDAGAKGRRRAPAA